MKLLDDYFKTQNEIFDYFGYREDWRVIPIDDSREMFWQLDGEGPGEVLYSQTAERLKAGREGEDSPGEALYANEIYTQRHLPKWVYRGKDFTMVCVDTHTDGNQFLQIFDNAKEVKE